MTRNKKIVIGIVCGFAGLGLSYWGIYKPLRKSNQKKADELDAKEKADAAVQANDPAAATLQRDYQAVKSTPDGFPLQYGSTDAKTNGAVTRLQNWLLSKYGSGVLGGNVATGKFLSYTDAAVRNHIADDGKVTEAWYNVNVLGRTPILNW